MPIMLLAEDREIMYMIKLKLDRPNNTLDYVHHIRGLEELDIDEDYGIVSIDPKHGLYVIRVIGEIDADKVRALSMVRGVYGDVRVAPIDKGSRKTEN